MGKPLHPTSLYVITFFLLYQFEAPSSASRLSSSLSAICVSADALLHIGVCVGKSLSIIAVQINGANAGVQHLTTRAGVLHSSC